MKIGVLALDGVFDTGLATVLDAFGTANELAGMLDRPTQSFELSIIGMRRKVCTALGLTVPVTALAGDTRFDHIVLPAIGTKMPGPLEQALERPDVGDATVALRGWSAGGARIAAACVGTFVLAESGLLDGHNATTTWWLSPLFRRRYPAVHLDEARMLVSSGMVTTAGAALSHIDLALWIIRRLSPELGAMTAKYLVVDQRPSQSSYIITDHLSHADPLVERFERWARERLASGFSLDDAANDLGTSKRTLARRLNEVLGKTPLSFFQDLRVEYAVHLLKTGNATIEQIATAVGYADGVTLRTLLRRRLGQGIRQIRAS